MTIVASLLGLVTGWTLLHVLTDTPMFLLASPPSIMLMRIKALLGLLPSTSDDPVLKSYQKMPWGATKMVLIRMLVFFSTSVTVHEVLWMLDEILYGSEYRKNSLQDSVFLVGSFRTGSTSLHRALAMDEERFVSPRFIELWYPFICVQKFFDWLESRDKLNGTTVIRDIEKKFQDQIGPDVMARHPMHWYEAEEEDLLLAAWHFVGWFLGASLPHPEAWIRSGQIHKLPKHEQHRSFLLYQRSMQKILYRRGNGRALLSKSHLIDMMPLLAENIPGAKFVGIVRHPTDAFCSWYGLTQASLSKLSTDEDEPENPQLLVQAHQRFWDCFTQSEMDFFLHQHNYKEDKDFSVVKFADYIADQYKVVRGLYKEWGYSLEGTAFEKRLEVDRTKHKTYKAKAKYSNPTLKELKISKDVFEEKYAEKIGRAHV